MLRGVTRRLKRESEASLSANWQAGAFAGQAIAGKLKPLKFYLNRQAGQGRATNQEILARFGAMAARGFDVKVG